MKQRKACLIFSTIAIILCLFISHATSEIDPEVEDEREFDYIPGSGKGPDKWGDLKKEWANCKNGTHQSPIDLSNQRVGVIKKSREMRKNYRPFNSTIINRGHDICLRWEGHEAGSIFIDGTEYFLKQCHWHSPSEHTIDGRRYDMELHMVHASEDNKLAVVGVLYKLGLPDPFLTKLLGSVMSMTEHDKKHQGTRNMGMVDPKDIKMWGKNYYRYMGSLTVPPCTEGVIWTINKKVSSVSLGQVRALRAAVHDYAEKNSRPVQPINERPVDYYGDDN